MNIFQLILFLLILVLFSCSSNKITTHDNIFRYNESSTITSLDPIFSNNQSNIWATNQIFSTLVQLDSSMVIKPLVAKDWFVTDNGHRYTFILRDNVYYHKSECFGIDSTRKLVANDFIYSLSRLANPDILSPGRWTLDYFNLDDVIALNDTVLEITLAKPFPGFLGLLTMNYFSFVPHEAVDYFGENFSSRPIGTGPFCFKKWKSNEKLILLKNPNYFEFEHNLRLPYLDGIAISFITQKESVFMNFMLDNIDFISGLDSSFKDELINSQGELLETHNNRFSILSNPYLNTEYLGVHLPKVNDENSPLMYKDFRKALNYCFNKSIMVKYLRNGLVYPADAGFVPLSLKRCYNIESNTLSQDSIKRLISETPNYDDEIILNTTSEYLDVCEFIQHSALEFGINIKIEISSPAVHRDLFSSGNASLFRASWIADYPDPENFLSLFYSKNKSPFGPNYTHFNNELYDVLYEKSFITTDINSRCDLFKEMELILLEEAIVVPLYYDYVFRLVSNKVKGMSINSMNTLCLKRVKKN